MNLSKSILIVVLLLGYCTVTAFATQQPVTTITSGTGTTGLNLKQYNDNYINPRLTNIQANDTDLYTNKADKSSFSSSSAFAAAWGWNPEDGGLPLGTSGQIITYNSSNNPIAISVPSITASEVSNLFSGTGEYLKKDGTTGDPTGSGGTFAGLTDLPSGVTLTTLGYLSGATANIQAQISAMSVPAFSPTNITSDPTSASPNGLYRNTATGHGWTVDNYGLWDFTAGVFTAWDMTPNAFGFGAITNATAGTQYCYTPQTITGFDRSVSIEPVGSTVYKINGGDPISISGMFPTGATISPCLTASATAGETVSGNVTIGGVSGNPPFTLTTVSCDDGILLNGCFSDNSTTGWTTSNGAVASASSGTVTLTNTQAAYGSFTADVETPIVIGNTYNYSYIVPAGLTTRCRLFIGGVSAVRTNVAGTYTGSVVATATARPLIQIDSSVNGASCSFNSPIKVW